MATIIWCDRVRHIVEEPRSLVAEHVTGALKRLSEGFPPEAFSGDPPVSIECYTPFIYVTPVNAQGLNGPQRALNVNFITSFEAMPGDGI